MLDRQQQLFLCDVMIKTYLAFYSYLDPSVLMLTEKDIEDTAVYINLHNLKSYNIQHLKTWLTYRGDSLKNVETLKRGSSHSIAILQARDREKAH